MKIQKLILITGCLGILVVPRVVNAHCGFCGKGESKAEGTSGKGQDPMAMMAKDLNLNADQKTKIQAIKDSTHKQMEALHEQTHAQIKAVLTPEQQVKFDQTMATHCEACAKGGAHKH